MASIVPPLQCYLVEWYRGALVGETVDRFAAVLDDRTALVSAGGARVHLLTLLAVPADEVIFGVFAATSSDLVARACAQAGIPAQRLSTAIDARIPHP